MNTNLLFGSTIALSFLFSCKQTSQYNAASQRPTSSKPNHERVTEAQAKSPKMLIARVKLSDVGQAKSPIEFVSLDQQMPVNNAEQVQAAFAAGQPMHLSQGPKGAQASNANYTVSLTATNVIQRPQMGLDGISFGYPSNYGYGPTPTQYGPQYGVPNYGNPNPYGVGSAGYGGGGGFYNNVLYAGGGILNFIGAMIGGIVNTIGGLLSALNPFNWFGALGIGYGTNGGISGDGYQYYPYNQIPNGTVVTGPNGYPYPYNQQYPTNPGTPAYPNGTTYPNGTYPNQPVVPVAPTGQEQMPAI